MNEPKNLVCERGGLLLSLRADGAATPEQIRELDAHLAACGACRAGAKVDVAVGDRLRERAAGAVPSGFSARVVAAAVAERAAAVAQNRFLRVAAAAAVFVAASALAWNQLAVRPVVSAGPAAASISARDAVVRPLDGGR